MITSRTVKFMENSQTRKVEVLNKHLNSIIRQVKESVIKINISKLEKEISDMKISEKILEPERNLNVTENNNQEYNAEQETETPNNDVLEF